jgi:hypothetical protein
MQLLEKRLILPHGHDRAPLCAFVSYIHPTKPVLLRRIGWEVSNDIHDDFSDSISEDNGRTWSEPRRALSSRAAEGGFIVHTESAALYLPGQDRLLHWTNDKFETSLKDGNSFDQNSRIRITVGDPESVSRGTANDVFLSDFGLKQGIYVSFCTPFRDSRGRFLVPVQWQRHDPEGCIRGRGFAARKDMPEVLADVWNSGLLIGEPESSNKLRWRLSEAVPYDFDKTSRGLCEPTIAELSDGRLVMILRGSNAAWPARPGYKWLAFSQDGGETWSEVSPLPADDGSLIESSATGSALFRSITNRKLYWIGNLCLEDRRPDGNMPRSPLYIAEILEEPFAIRRSTLAVIDRARPGEHPDTQHSNFKFYQDRVTGDVVLYLTRYGERGYEHGRWILADLHQYRVALD